MADQSARSWKNDPDIAYSEAVQRVRIARENERKEINLTKLKALSAIPPLESLLTVEKFDVSHTQVGDLSPVRQLVNLQILRAVGTGVSDLSPLRDLRSLHTIEITGTPVHDLSHLTQLTELRVLRIAGTNISDLSPLSKLGKLEILQISGTKVSDLSPLRSLPHLHTLRAANTRILDLSILRHLTELRTIALSMTKVFDLTPIARLPAVTSLKISNTAVTDLSPIATMESLLIGARGAPQSGGLHFSNLSLEDKFVAGLAGLGNPTRTAGVISYLRRQAGLPELDSEIRDLVAPPELPEQEPGPHFIIRENDGVIDFAPLRLIDREGNNVARLQALHPLVVEAAKSLVAGVSRNEQPHLRELASMYLAFVDQNLSDISFVRLYGLGLRLQNASLAAGRNIAGRILPELEDPAREALDSLLDLHGPFILSTKDGLDLIEVAERHRRRPEDEQEFRDAALELAKALEASPYLVDPRAAKFVRETIAEAESATHPERTTTYRVAAAKNISIVILAGSTIGALPVIGGIVAGPAGIVAGGTVALIGFESLKKSKPFSDVTGTLTSGVDMLASAEFASLMSSGTFRRYAEFVVKHDKLMRRLAGDNTSFNWLIRHLDWIGGRLKKSSEAEQQAKPRRFGWWNRRG